MRLNVAGSHACSNKHAQPCSLRVIPGSCCCCRSSSSSSSSCSATVYSRRYEAEDSLPTSDRCTMSAAQQSQEQQLPHRLGLPTAGVMAAVMAAIGTISNTAAAAAAGSGAEAAISEGIVPVDPSTYVPGPVEVGWQIWFAAAVSTVPFIIGSYEFGKRILIQRRCQVCGGSGLVHRGRFQRKCPECGGFFPWISWQMFLSANARPGNGGPLLQPRGQTSVFYTVPPPPDSAASPMQQSSDSFDLPMQDSQAQQQQQQAPGNIGVALEHQDGSSQSK